MRQRLETLAAASHRAAGVLARLPRRLLMLLVRAYRLLLKPWLGNACRFEPTCSQYALDALQRHGAIVGSAMTAGRILRCNPWCDGGCDPVAARAPGLFRALGLGASDADGAGASVSSPSSSPALRTSSTAPSRSSSAQPSQPSGEKAPDGGSTSLHAAFDEAAQRTPSRQAILETRS